MSKSENIKHSHEQLVRNIGGDARPLNWILSKRNTNQKTNSWWVRLFALCRVIYYRELTNNKLLPAVPRVSRPGCDQDWRCFLVSSSRLFSSRLPQYLFIKEWRLNRELTRCLGEFSMQTTTTKMVQKKTMTKARRDARRFCYLVFWNDLKISFCRPHTADEVLLRTMRFCAFILSIDRDLDPKSFVLDARCHPTDLITLSGPI